MIDIVPTKIAQEIYILKKEGIDAWLTFGRETTAVYDPALSLIYGIDLT